MPVGDGEHYGGCECARCKMSRQLTYDRWQQAEASFAELQRLRAIEAAAQELGAHAPVAILVMTDEWSCCYCGGVVPFTVDAREPEHNPGCKWVALQAALGQQGRGSRER
jgi:hypothetical protein